MSCIDNIEKNIENKNIIKKKIAVIFGGASSEHKVSLMSAYSVLNNVSYELFDVVKIGITEKGVWFVYNGDIQKIKDGTWENDTDNLVPAVISPCTVQHGLFLFNKAEKTFTTERIDVAFPLIHGKGGEDGSIQGLLSLAGIPYVGCGILSSACCLDKVVAKEICEKEGIDTVPWVCVSKYELDEKGIENIATRIEASVPYPVFVKPSKEGSSIGTSKAKDRKELFDSINTALLYDDKILVEKYVKAREIEVAAMGKDEGCVFISSPGEIVPVDFYDYASKYENDTAALHVPAELSENEVSAIKEKATKVFSALHCKGFCRIDFFVSEDKIYLNEVNTIPGFTHISMYPKLMEHDGISYSNLITMLLDSASL